MVSGFVESKVGQRPLFHPLQRTLVWLNVLGGLGVLGSYAHGFVANASTVGEVWGGVPQALRPLYTSSMLAAAAGYFAFSFFVFFRLDPREARISDRVGYEGFLWLYALILFPSALWMPLTFEMLEAPGAVLWWAIRLVLAAVGVASLGLLLAISSVKPAPARIARGFAHAGALAIVLQTGLLDAIVWPAYFPR
jgi:hypothetical protein